MLYSPSVFVLLGIVVGRCTLSAEAFAFSSRSSSMIMPTTTSSCSTCRRSSVTDGDTIAAAADTTTAVENETESDTLPNLFPAFASSLSALRFSTPTPIQSASAKLTLNKENVLLIAPTGSGKTLAYLLPALTNAMDDTDGTVLIVAPTRELALQLAKDAKSLLVNLPGSTVKDANRAVQLTVRGMDAPTPNALSQASILVGTPPEVVALVDNGSARDLIAALRVVVLDEVDVLLPPSTKATRSNLDRSKGDKRENSNKNEAQEERRQLAQKRKLTALKRKSTTDISSGEVVTPTERILRAVSLNELPPQILAGSATASRKTLEVLNRVLRNADKALASGGNAIKPEVKVVRPAEAIAADDNVDVTSRAITVPSQVAHRYISLSKEAASSADSVLAAVAKASKVLQPQTALLFLCGEFGRSNGPKLAKTVPPKPKKGKYRNVQKKIFNAKSKAGSMSGQPDSLSARGACAKLASFGIDAKPLHVALGLEPNAAATTEDESGNDASDDATEFLVTFEGSARGLHLDAVDAVFVVGRPASAASYLHLAGRVGRFSADAEGGVTIRPGTVVSLCTKGGAKELEKWTKQIGGTIVEELDLTTTVS